MTEEPIGIIGLGLVGSVLAERLAAEGGSVVGYDSDPEKARSTGLRLVESAPALCDHCPVIFLSLPHSGVVDAVLGEIGTHLTPQHLIIDTTTGDPEDARAHQALLARSQTDFIEATIAGSSDLLRQRAAGLFLGGKPEALARAQPLFDVLAEHCFHLGDMGAASRFKLVFNLALGLHRAVLAEALHFGQALGFAPEQTLAVLQQSPAASRVMATKGQKMVDAAYTPPQARLSQHLKDVRLMLTEAERTGASLPLSTTHRALLEQAETLGYGAVDTAAVMEAYRQASRIET